jgi:hypothetical protein
MLVRTKKKQMMSSLASAVSILREARTFVTLGKSGRGKHDYVGLVLERFFYSTPEFEKSLESQKARRNGWALRGAWPSSGKHIFDWEIEAWGERGGGVVVKVYMWDAKGGMKGISYRTTLATVDRLVPKFLRKFFYPVKSKMKKVES